jgi:hypothetical protein
MPSDFLVPQHPHYPSGKEDPAYEHCETIQAVAHLFGGIAALSDAEHHRRKKREKQGSGEV